MSKKQMTILFDRAVELARRDRRKTALIGAVGLLLLSLSCRFLSQGPNSAPAAIVVLPPSSNPVVESPATVELSNSGAVTAWLKEPRQSAKRNLFALNLEDYPTDSSITAGAGNHISNAPSDQSLWDDVAKSLSARADQKREQEFRMKNLQRAAARLLPQQVIVGPPPRAQVNGEWIEEGSFVGSFRVLRIEADRITVEKDGITLDVPVH
jgi:hypothetical protein